MSHVEIKIPKFIYDILKIWANGLGITVEKLVKRIILEEIEQIENSSVDIDKFKGVKLKIYMNEKDRTRIDTIRKVTRCTSSWMILTILLHWLNEKSDWI